MCVWVRATVGSKVSVLKDDTEYWILWPWFKDVSSFELGVLNKELVGSKKQPNTLLILFLWMSS